MTSSRARPKVLIIATRAWPIAARVSSALTLGGFDVGAIYPKNSPARYTKLIAKRYQYRTLGGRKSIADAIADWRPKLLLCSDERALSELREIYLQEKFRNNGAGSELSNLIEHSTADPAQFDVVLNKSRFIEYAASRDIACPKTINVPPSDFTTLTDAAAYPALIKADGSFGGAFVRQVQDAREARRTIREFLLPSSWPALLRSWCAATTPLWLFRAFSRQLRTICLQEIIAGPSANIGLACWKGEVIGAIMAEVIESAYPNGPATVIKLIDNREIFEVASRLVGELKLTGLVGFDFVFDSTGKPFLIELNPRVTPTCYVRHGRAADLAKALHPRLSGSQAECPSLPHTESIALFPQELQRQLSGPAISAQHLDIPWDDPELAMALMKTIFRAGLRMKIGAWRRNRQLRARVHVSNQSVAT